MRSVPIVFWYLVLHQLNRNAAITFIQAYLELVTCYLPYDTY